MILCGVVSSIYKPPTLTAILSMHENRSGGANLLSLHNPGDFMSGEVLL